MLALSQGRGSGAGHGLDFCLEAGGGGVGGTPACLALTQHHSSLDGSSRQLVSPHVLFGLQY